jgi:putative transcriptional regulator
MKEPCAILLTEYAAGTMDDGLALVVASYLSFCADSRAHVKQCQTLAGTMLETLCEPVGMRDGSLQSVLARLDAPAPVKAHREKMNLCDDIALPEPVAALLCGCDSQVKWRGIGGGSRIAILPKQCCGSTVMALNIAPGRAMPRHEHSGIELTLVLRGAYNDEFGHYPAGTLAINEAGTTHTPVADARQGCVCISAVQGVRDAGFFARLINHIFR